MVAGVGLFGSVELRHLAALARVRRARGARRESRAIVSRSLGRSVRLVLIGVAPGLLIAAAFGRWIQPLLYRTPAFDPLTIVVAAALMFVVAITASTWPALRAARADPNRALRSE